MGRHTGTEPYKSIRPVPLMRANVRELLGEGPKFRGEISLGNTVVRLKRRRAVAEEVHRRKNYCTGSSSRSLSPLPSFLSFSSFSLPSLPLPSPPFREHATCCRECQLAPLEASRTLVAVLVFPFSRSPGRRRGRERRRRDVSFGRVFGETSLTRAHGDGLRERRTGPVPCSL